MPTQFAPRLTPVTMTLVGAQARLRPRTTNRIALKSTTRCRFETWSDIITDATDRMKSGELEKVVLSRVCELRFEDRVNIDSALDFLRQKYAGCYLFLFEPSPHLAFYGATPELLVQVEGREIRDDGAGGIDQARR